MVVATGRVAPMNKICNNSNCSNEVTESFLSTCPTHSDSCPICLDSLTSDIDDISRMACGHVFHSCCLYKWLNESDKCPMCREIKYTGVKK